MASNNGDQPPALTTVTLPAKLLMGSDPDNHERLKDLLKKEEIFVVMASSNNDEDTNPASTSTVAVMHPRLLMAARNGDFKVLENLLVNHQVCQTVKPHFVIQMPKGSSTTEDTAGDTQHPRHGTDEDIAQSANCSNEIMPDQQTSCVGPGKSTVHSSTSNSPCSVVHQASLEAAMPSVVSLLDGVTLDSEEDSTLHVVAASGDSVQYLQCAELIYAKAGHLLDAGNKNGDTPLHCAARAGNPNMVSRIIELATHERDDKKRVLELLRKMNRIGETPLHGAVRSANREVLEKLMSEDPELVHLPGDGVSPLYLAFSLGKLDFAWELIQRSSKKLSYSGPDGRNVLHIAVFQHKELSTLVEICKDEVVEVQHGNQTQRVPLLLQLTSQRDKNGSTPLHFAVSLETRISNGFSRWSERFWSKPSPTTLLLEANETAVYQPDNQGSYPIHVAACSGKLKAVMILVRRCPDCATLRNARGRTFLHIAVEKKRYDVVAFVCRSPEFKSILNAQDRHGNTALHLAVQVGDLSIFNCLIRNRQNPRFMMPQSLVLAGAAIGYSRPDHFNEKYMKPRDENKESEYTTNATQVTGISSVLVATVTFAAAFTFLLYSGVASRDISNRLRYYLLSRHLLHGSVRSLIAAFAMGMYVVLAPVAPKMAASVCVISFGSLLFGNMDLWRYLVHTNTLRVRKGILAARPQVRPILKVTFRPFWSYIIIFGLPAILKIHGTH
ncbi:hypothetical protein EJB05_33350, partial [Eragrostis curvula]